MRFGIVFIFLVSVSGCALLNSKAPIEYALLHQENNETDNVKNFKHIGNAQENIELYTATPADIFIQRDGDVYTRVGGITHPKKGEVVDCDGYQNTCLVLDELFKFKIPADFDFINTNVWSWEDFKYETISKRKVDFLGQQHDIVEIIGFSKKSPTKVVEFYVSEKKGLLYFTVRLEGYRAIYVLSTYSGLWGRF